MLSGHLLHSAVTVATACKHSVDGGGLGSHIPLPPLVQLLLWTRIAQELRNARQRQPSKPTASHVGFKHPRMLLSLC
jgi:hypothetical protein